MRLSSLLTVLLLLAAPALARADLIVGQVVDANGVGVPGVDIDVKNLGSGGTPPIFNDGTDANGFFSTTVPAGLYRVTFTPPPPPTTTHLIVELDDVTILGTTNLGVIPLPAGVSLSTRVIDPLGFPVAGVNADVIELSTGDNLNLANDTSDAFGNLSVAVPTGDLELRLKTSGVIGQVLAPKALQVTTSANTNLGDTPLVPGFSVSGVLQSASGVGVPDADLDFRDPVSGTKLFTPGDNTDPLGNFSVVVKAGSYDIEFCPLPSTFLAPTRVPGVAVNANLSLGVVTAVNGVLLSGTIRDWTGAIRPGASVDLEVPLTNTHPLLCTPRSDQNGQYSILVAPGTYDVTFKPQGFSLPLGEDKHPGVVLAGNTVLDGTLPECPFSTPYGIGAPGTGGVVPVLSDTGGAPRLNNGGWAWQLDGGVGGGTAILLVSLRKASLPLFGHTMLVDPAPPRLMRTLSLSGASGVAGAGSATFPLPAPLAPSLAGVPFYAQFAVLDPSPFGNVALSNGLQTTFCQ